MLFFFFKSFSQGNDCRGLDTSTALSCPQECLCMCSASCHPGVQKLIRLWSSWMRTPGAHSSSRYRAFKDQLLPSTFTKSFGFSSTQLLFCVMLCFFTNPYPMSPCLGNSMCFIPTWLHRETQQPSQVSACPLTSKWLCLHAFIEERLCRQFTVQLCCLRQWLNDHCPPLKNSCSSGFTSFCRSIIGGKKEIPWELFLKTIWNDKKAASELSDEE